MTPPSAGVSNLRAAGPGNPRAAGAGHPRAAGPGKPRSLRLRAGARGGDAGSAVVEFVGLSVLLILPVTYLMLAVFDVQRSAFGVTQAAREAGRAFATADSTHAAFSRAQLAARTALQDQGVEGVPLVGYVPAGAGCGAGTGGGGEGAGVATLRPGATFTVCVRMDVALPYASGGRFAGFVPATMAVTGQFDVVVDEYRRKR